MADLQVWKVDKPHVKMFCELGEGPIYERDLHRLRFFDINKGKLHILDLNKGPEHLETHHCGTISTSAEIEGNDEEVVVGARRGFAILNRKTHKVEYIHKVWNEQKDPGKDERMRFNDGAVDPQGRYWAGTMNDKSPNDEGVLFRLNNDKTVDRVLEKVTIPNGMGWTFDQKHMYFTDSPSGNIYKFAFDPKTGNISDREVFFHLDKDDGEWPVPDGFAQDVEGNLWVALCGGWKVLRINPKGEVTGEILLPTRLITCPAFVGTDLFITSALEDKPEKYPRSVEFGGSLFKVNVGIQGGPVHKYKRKW